MVNNISKYINLNDHILLEYEFNKKEEIQSLSFYNIKTYVAITNFGEKQHFNQYSQGYLNNDLHLNSLPVLENKSEWYINTEDTIDYWNFFENYEEIYQTAYVYDTIKIHVVSGYNFDDIAGFLLQVKAKDVSGNLVNLSNFTWVNQVLGDDVLKFSTNNLFLAGKYFDKYIEFKIPSVQKLGGNTTQPLEHALQIQELSDIYFEFTIIPEIIDNKFIVNNKIEFQLPVTSNADNFNALIFENTNDDYIEFYATWKDEIIGNYIGDIESGRIKLYTSNNPNDNFDQFTDLYGNANKWVVMHELYVYEDIPGNRLLTQQYVFTQTDNFSFPNYFRPVTRYSDIAATFSIDYICRLSNRMDGTQIIRKLSFSSPNVKKYGKKLQLLNVDNLSSYKIFNRLDNETAPVLQYNGEQPIKYIKVFYDTTNIRLNMNNEVLEEGTESLSLKEMDNLYKFSFKKINTNKNDELVNVDLSGAYQYALLFKLDDGNKIEIEPTYSDNMNLVIGELEFKISEEQSAKLKQQVNTNYSIIIKNPDNSFYTFYQGKYYSV